MSSRSRRPAAAEAVVQAGSVSEAPPYVEEVLETVEAIPPGRVLAYGDVAALVGRGGPRQVGRVLAQWGGAVPWWRVLRADGTHAEPLRPTALAHLREEGTPQRPDGRVDMARARWHPQLPASVDPDLSDPRGGIAP